MKYNLYEIEKNHVENLELLDTEHADIIANSPQPELEINLIKWGATPEEARKQTQWLIVLSRQPQTSQEEQKWIETWEEVTGRTLSEQEFQEVFQPLWNYYNQLKDSWIS